MSVQTDESEPLLQVIGRGENSGNFLESRTSSTRRPPQGSTWYEASFLIINATLGAALLNIPQAYDRAGGIFAANILMGVTLTFVIGALLILAHCSDQNGSATYQDVVLGASGNFGRQQCAAFIALYMFGACTAYLVVIGDQHDRVLASLYGTTFCHFWYMERKFTLPATAIILIFPMCFSRRIDFLKHPSTVGVISALYLVFLVVYKYVTETKPATDIKTSPTDWTDVFLVLPTLCFGFQCHVSSVPVYSCLRNRTLGTFTYSILLAMTFCAVAYGVVAIFGYLTFGAGVPSDIMMVYDAQDPVVLIGIIMLAIKTVVAYPILLFCGRTAVDGILHFATKPLPGIWEQSEKRRRMWISGIWFTATLVLAVFIPNIGTVISPLGSLAAFMIFIYPGICLMQHILRKDPHMYLLKDRLLLLVSLLFEGVGTFILVVVWTQEFSGKRAAEAVLLCQ